MRKTIFAIYLTICSISIYAWQVKGDYIQESRDFPYGIYGYQVGSLIIDFKKKFNCEPIFSLIMTNGDSLGHYINGRNAETARDYLNISYKNRKYSAFPRVNFYTNGVEYSASFGVKVASQIENNSDIIVSIGDGQIYGFRTGSDFIALVNKARRACS